jgi:cytochrome c-type biogenesis protein CcmF
MPALGFFCLSVAFLAVLVSVVGLLASVSWQLSQQRLLSKKALREAEANASKKSVVQLVAYASVALSDILLTLCCVILVVAFLSGDNSIEYVVKYRSDSTSQLAWFFKLSGLWAGREGSLLFWAWLISLFNLVVALRSFKKAAALDSAALAVSQIVLLAFLAVLVFANDNMPFVPLAAEYLDADGALTGNATLWGMNALLEHWAMAIHPPTLFVGSPVSPSPLPTLLPRSLLTTLLRHGRSARSAMPCSPGCFWALVLAWGRYGHTWCLAGAATGVGILWRMPACFLG